MTGERTACPRTRGLVERIAGERVTAEDVAHAGDCPTCGPIMARAAGFDDELRRAARGLVTDELPRGVLDPGLTPSTIGVIPGMNGAPGLLGVLAAIVIFIAGTSIAFRQAPLGPASNDPNATPPSLSFPASSFLPATSGPTLPPVRQAALRSTAEVGGDLIGLDYLCQSGREREGVGQDELVVRDGIVCYSPKSLTLTSVVVITGETQRGNVAEVSIKGTLVGEDNVAARSQLAETMAKATFLVILDAEDAPAAGDFVLAHVPDLRLEPGGDAATGTFGSVQVSIRRQQDGGYLLLLRSSGS